MAYMSRLSLWGPGTPYLTFKDFFTQIKKRGEGAMECIAMDVGFWLDLTFFLLQALTVFLS
jgi:hypothetical protein